ncbi:MAG: heavy metal translocating P-type ATPase [Bacillota bacterium]|jgi:Cd2+/Zn2+-exporting ATPase
MNLSTMDWLMIAVAIAAGAPTAKEAVTKLRMRQFSIALLVVLASIGAILIGEAWEAAVVTVLYVLGGWLESRTLARTRSALRELVDAMPRTARVRRGDDIVEVSAYEVVRGDIVVVRPGDLVPVDGEVVAGSASLDTSSVTGESMPMEAGVGAQVTSGSVSLGGYLEIRAEQVGADTTFSRLIYLVAEAGEQKPKVQRTLDRFAQWYTPSVIGASVVVYLISRDMHLALTFLVIACPGALVAAAPVAMIAGLGSSARRGVLIKGGERLERIAGIDTVAFDKTGTLTLGRPSVVAVEAFEGSSPQQVLAAAASAELRSEHHLASAILARAEADGVDPLPARDWDLRPGRGVVAVTDDGLRAAVGNTALMKALGVAVSPEQLTAVESREAEGETVAMVSLADRAIGLIGIADEPRPDAAQAIAALRDAGIDRIVMLTGDNRRAAEHIGAVLGIHSDYMRAGLMPDEKVSAIRDLQAAGARVAMVGDGINDAPALAMADVSIAMGASATRAAMEAADIALMSNNLMRIPQAMTHSRRILRVVRQNVALAVGVVVFLLAGVLAGRVHLASGMAVHEASILAVTLNGMRLLKQPRGS